MLILFPFSINTAFEKEEKAIDVKEIIPDKKDLIYNDLNLILKEFYYFESKGNNIKIEVHDFQKIKELEKKEGINITTIKNSGDNKYIIEVRR
ncbi:MAG: hypothetical protein ACRC2K_08840 [Clostridium sp.]